MVDVHVYTVFTRLHDGQLPIRYRWSHDHCSFLPSSYWLVFPITRVYIVLLPKGMRWENPCSLATSYEVSTTQTMPLKLGDVHCLLEKKMGFWSYSVIHFTLVSWSKQNQAAPLRDTKAHKSYLCKHEQTIYSLVLSLWVWKQRVS